MNAAVYIEGAKGRRRHSVPIDEIKQKSEKFLLTHGWSLYGFYIHHENEHYEDGDVQVLIEEMYYGSFHVLVADSVLDILRNYILTEKIKGILPSGQLQIVTLDGAINTIERSIHEFIAYANMRDMERKSKSEFVKTTLQKKARKGVYQASVPPYGYKVVDKQLVVREDNLPDVIRYIFNSFLEGKSADFIAKDLTEKGYPTPAKVANKSNVGIKWQGSSIRKILINPHYTGCLVYGKEMITDLNTKTRQIVPEEERIYVQNTHEAIISPSLFKKVQEEIQRRSKNKQGRKSVKN